MAQNLDPLRTSFDQKPQWWVFAFATETTVQELKNCSKNGNTAKNTGFWLSVSKNLCVDKEITDDIENYEPAEFNHGYYPWFNTLLEHFYAEDKQKR